MRFISLLDAVNPFWQTSCFFFSHKKKINQKSDVSVCWVLLIFLILFGTFILLICINLSFLLWIFFKTAHKMCYFTICVLLCLFFLFLLSQKMNYLKFYMENERKKTILISLTYSFLNTCICCLCQFPFNS